MAAEAHERQVDFRLEEYKALRKEIEIYTQESRSLERYTMGAVGACWAWLIANKIHDWVPWLIPIVFTLAVAIRGFSVSRHFRQIGEYLTSVESQFGVKGWEHQRPGMWVNHATQIVAWGLLAICVIALFTREELILR